MRTTLLALIAAVALGAMGCAGSTGGRTLVRSGVPMVYDPVVRAYVVESHPNVYYAGGHYFRVSNQGWERSRGIDGPWAPCSKHRLPPGLRKKFDHDRRATGHGRDRN